MTIDESDSRDDLEIRAKRIFARWEWIIPMQIDREIAFLAMLEIWLISKSLSTIISIAGEIMIPFGSAVRVAKLWRARETIESSTR